MKNSLLAFSFVLCGFLTGCNGVTLNAKYSQLLDQTAALSQETANRASAGQLTDDQKNTALVNQAQTWQLFRDARDGVAPTAAAATTQAAQ